MQLTPNLDIGGAQETVRTIAKYLPRAGVGVVVCSFRDGDLRGPIEDLGVPVEILPDRKHSAIAVPWFLAEMRARRRELIETIERHNVSVVQTQGLGSLDFLAMTVGPKARVWWTIQNASFQLRKEQVSRFPWLFGAKRASHRLLYRLGQSFVSGVIAVSPDTATSYRQYAGGNPNVEVVPNAVDTEMYPAQVDRAAVRQSVGLEPPDIVVVVVATFKRQKGHVHLVDAIEKAVDTLPRLRVVLVGDGDLRHGIEQMVDDRQLTDHFRFLGSRNDVPDLLAAADVFVLPSLWEGLSVALLEAMASGIPVIATDVSGTREVVVDGETGLLVPPGAPEPLANALLSTVADGHAAATRATEARTIVSTRYSARAQAELLLDVFGLKDGAGGSTPRPQSNGF